MIMTMTTMSITVDEFVVGDFPEGSELFEGTVWMNDPNFRHQDICLRLIDALGGAGFHHRGFGGNWRLGDHTVLKPDVWWASDEVWAQTRGETIHSGLPQLAVEVRSPGTWARDIGLKRVAYMANDVLELWLVDIAAASVIVVRPDGSPLGNAVEICSGSLTSPLLPGFDLTLDDLFAD